MINYIVLIASCFTGPRIAKQLKGMNQLALGWNKRKKYDNLIAETS